MIRMGCRNVADSVIERIRKETEVFVAKGNRAPSLAVVLVGNDSASETYVRKKKEACESLGFLHFQYTFDEDVKEERILSLIDELNCNDDVDAILVQLPLPKHIDEKKIIERISPEKDADGFSPVNIGRLLIGEEAFVPCTPNGIMEILRYYSIPTAGKKAVVIGRSNIVGKPMANLLSAKGDGADCTVTLCHSRTPDISHFTLDADIIIAALGHPKFLTRDMVKPGAAVIDVGITRVEDKSKKSGFRLQGDVDYENVAPIASYITPVPGGVGPMTIVSLLKNTITASIKKQSL